MRKRMIILAVLAVMMGAVTSNAVADDPFTRDYRIDVEGVPIKLACVNGPDDIFYQKFVGVNPENVDALGATVEQAPNWLGGPPDVARTMEKVSDLVFVERDDKGEVTLAMIAGKIDGRYVFLGAMACDPKDFE